MLLAGDIGGTKTDLAIYSPDKGPRDPLVGQKYPSAEYPSLVSIVQEFLDQTNIPVDKAVFGVAGPVVGGKAQITNLPWFIDVSELQMQCDLEVVHLLNDLESIAHAVPFLEEKDLHPLSKGEPSPGGTIVVVAPGTGLGEAYLTWDGARYHAFSSEGGHADFAPVNQVQRDLLRYLQDKAGIEHVSYELVCSGKGIKNIYTFLKHSGKTVEPSWLSEKVSASEDPVPLIINSATGKEQRCEICDLTMEIFVSILGAEAGNMALNLLANGGVYLGGGIPPRILPALEKDRFMQAFFHKGRLSELLAKIPVNVILNTKAALLGAACFGLELDR